MTITTHLSLGRYPLDYRFHEVVPRHRVEVKGATETLRYCGTVIFFLLGRIYQDLRGEGAEKVHEYPILNET